MTNCIWSTLLNRSVYSNKDRIWRMKSHCKILAIRRKIWKGCKIRRARRESNKRKIKTKQARWLNIIIHNLIILNMQKKTDFTLVSQPIGSYEIRTGDIKIRGFFNNISTISLGFILLHCFFLVKKKETRLFQKKFEKVCKRNTNLKNMTKWQDMNNCNLNYFTVKKKFFCPTVH